jgi:hypothetical protein
MYSGITESGITRVYCRFVLKAAVIELPITTSSPPCYRLHLTDGDVYPNGYSLYLGLIEESHHATPRENHGARYL